MRKEERRIYRFVICDDESADLLYIRSRVSEWAKTQCLEVDVEEFPLVYGCKMVYAVPPAYGRSESSGQAGEAFDRERVLECLQKAGIAEMTEKLPKGIDTNIGKDFEEDGISLLHIHDLTCDQRRGKSYDPGIILRIEKAGM